jgi:asparagine synthase (glutamine-hydrolysing)
MCGILGKYEIENTIRNSLFSDALVSLKHRGPDHHGFEEYNNNYGSLFLGHTRLSIIDLSEAGQQPMVSKNGRYHIIFNGEIYNYKEIRDELSKDGLNFKSDSDTEVLIEAWSKWGMSCLDMLKGMFVFVIYDVKKNNLTCIRDPFGIKPFYYNINSKKFIFSSEISPVNFLLQSDKDFDYQTIYNYLVFGHYDNNTSTFYKNISNLMPGCYLEVELGNNIKYKIGKWFELSTKENTKISFNGATEKLRNMFLENIKLHMRSDVPLAIALSGGVDSSAVACAVRTLYPNLEINTFTYVAKNSDVDEEIWADKINNHINAKPHKVIVNPIELANDLTELISAQGEPFGSSSIYAQYRVFKLAKQSGITVLLEGQGADELFAGYHGYPGSMIKSLIEKKHFLKLLKFINNWSKWPGRSYKKALVHFFQAITPQFLEVKALKIIGRDPFPEWIKTETLANYNIEFNSYNKGHHKNYKGRSLMENLKSSLTGNGLMSLLRHSDRNSMHWSMESRVPFLTSDMAKFALSLPENYLISEKGETKSIFKSAMRGIVPDDILDRKDKIGFQTPEHDIMKHIHKSEKNVLDDLKSIPFINFELCNKEFDDMINGNKKYSFLAWRLLNLSIWLKINNTK